MNLYEQTLTKYLENFTVKAASWPNYNPSSQNRFDIFNIAKLSLPDLKILRDCHYSILKMSIRIRYLESAQELCAIYPLIWQQSERNWIRGAIATISFYANNFDRLPQEIQNFSLLELPPPVIQKEKSSIKSLCHLHGRIRLVEIHTIIKKLSELAFATLRQFRDEPSIDTIKDLLVAKLKLDSDECTFRYDAIAHVIQLYRALWSLKKDNQQILVPTPTRKRKRNSPENCVKNNECLTKMLPVE